MGKLIYIYIYIYINYDRQIYTYEHSNIAMGYVILLLFIYKIGVGIKYLRKLNIPLNKETKTSLVIDYNYFGCSWFFKSLLSVRIIFRKLPK